MQYFTGTAGTVKSYNFAGGQILAGQRYNNCIRTEKGYCAIQWKESSTTSPDPFSLDSISVVGSNGVGPPAPAVLCDTAYIAIPNLSPDGIVGIPMPVGLYQSWQSQVCGSNFGIEGMSVASVLVSKSLTSQTHYIKLLYTLSLFRSSAAIRVGSLHSCTWHSSLSICNYWVQFGLYSAALLNKIYWSEVWSSLTS